MFFVNPLKKKFIRHNFFGFQITQEYLEKRYLINEIKVFPFMLQKKLTIEVSGL